RSIQQLMVLAPPAASAPPITTAAIKPSAGTPRCAKSIGGTAVTSNSSMTRGFVRRTYEPIVATSGRDRRSRGIVGCSIGYVESTGRMPRSFDHDLADHSRGGVTIEGALERIGTGGERHRPGG